MDMFAFVIQFTYIFQQVNETMKKEGIVTIKLFMHKSTSTEIVYNTEEWVSVRLVPSSQQEPAN